jgi:hypothetical protein
VICGQCAREGATNRLVASVVWYGRSNLLAAKPNPWLLEHAEMGKPYETELRQLPETYDWALRAPISDLTEAVALLQSSPLVAVGSGGSLSAAHFVASLHQSLGRGISRAATPLDIATAIEQLGDVSVMMLSAGGSNPDVIGSFRRVAEHEPPHVVAICGRTGSKLAAVAQHYRYVHLFEAASPVREDGFLATNSLLALTTVLARAYQQLSGAELRLPAEFASLVHPGLSTDAFMTTLADQCAPLWERETLVVLYSPPLAAVACDIESRFTEAALGAIQLADYRNFAHGRHHWLAKRAPSSAVLALTIAGDRSLADRTMKHFPSGIPTVRVELPHDGHQAALAGLVTAQYIAGLAGQAKGIDPGRPGVPRFGSRIYHMQAFGGRVARVDNREIHRSAAIRRKAQAAGIPRAPSAPDPFWRTAYDAFIERLERAQFGGVLFDYDGTLCDRRRRSAGLESQIVDALNHLVEMPLTIGVATGRGRSVRKALRDALPESRWGGVFIGYYNGAACTTLASEALPAGLERTCPELAVVGERLMADRRLQSIATVTRRDAQITVEPTAYWPCDVLWGIVEEVTRGTVSPGVTVVRSSHSIDVLAPGVSKETIIAQMRGAMSAASASDILCIGDRGRWPGNDFTILRQPFSLSVDEVSVDPDTCWNIAAPGHRGVQATVEYLRMLVRSTSGDAVQFRLTPQSTPRP